MTYQDLADHGWYMDTGATAHLTSQPGALSLTQNSSSLPIVTVGNGSSLPVIAKGFTSFPTSSRPLYLQKILLCPGILKNLVSVRQFTKDNSCSIEFDHLGFLVKDLCTRAPIIRCDIKGPLYSIKSPSPHQALVANTIGTKVWHCRLGHPGNSTLRFYRLLVF
uniref:Retrovirus-related Pol polyprotein from transposon TNT 1-94-like beta-barrel domain-containing protein n=1 Tax=Noccaea caerulescens TaxID=107243 RepID=A0A1J3ITL3_NOCCA